jgi:hypothetical protein
VQIALQLQSLYHDQSYYYGFKHGQEATDIQPFCLGTVCHIRYLLGLWLVSMFAAARLDHRESIGGYMPDFTGHFS